MGDPVWCGGVPFYGHILTQLYFPFSFAISTETKSGRVIKTPGKYSSCVTGKRNSKKGCNISSDLQSAFIDDSDSQINTSSLFVNTSQNVEQDTTFNTVVDERMKTSPGVEENDSSLDM